MHIHAFVVMINAYENMNVVHDMKTTCMHCTYYKIEDEWSGYCRMAVNGKSGEKTEERSLVRHDATCRKWKDCGQQYYIRIGWLKAQKKKDINA